MIVPVYNTKPYLEEALDSVVRQTYAGLDILLIDDGSNDGSAEICDRYALRDRRIRVVHQGNLGLSAARNAGLDRMAGQAVTFLDADDALHPDAIRRMLEAMLREDVDMAICRSVVCRTERAMRLPDSESVRGAGEPGRYDQREAMRAVVDGRIKRTAWGKLYRAELWKDLRFPVGHVYEDNYVVMDLMERIGGVFVMDDALVLHRKRAGSITATATLENLRDLCLGCDRILDAVKAHIPAVFTPGQLQRARGRSVEAVLAYAVKVDRKNPEKAAIDALALEKAGAIYSAMKPGRRSLKQRVSYGLFRRCPLLLSSLYPIYHALRTAVRRGFER